MSRPCPRCGKPFTVSPHGFQVHADTNYTFCGPRPELKPAWATTPEHLRDDSPDPFREYNPADENPRWKR